MDLTEKTLESQRLFTGRIINLCLDKALLPDGSVANRELVQHPGGVSVAALTENNEIYMVRQFRYPYQQVLLELPAGKLEKGRTLSKPSNGNKKKKPAPSANRISTWATSIPLRGT